MSLNVCSKWIAVAQLRGGGGSGRAALVVRAVGGRLCDADGSGNIERSSLLLHTQLGTWHAS